MLKESHKLSSSDQWSFSKQVDEVFVTSLGSELAHTAAALANKSQ